VLKYPQDLASVYTVWVWEKFMKIIGRVRAITKCQNSHCTFYETLYLTFKLILHTLCWRTRNFRPLYNVCFCTKTFSRHV